MPWFRACHERGIETLRSPQRLGSVHRAPVPAGSRRAESSPKIVGAGNYGNNERQKPGGPWWRSKPQVEDEIEPGGQATGLSSQHGAPVRRNPRFLAVQQNQTDSS